MRVFNFTILTSRSPQQLNLDNNAIIISMYAFDPQTIAPTISIEGFRSKVEKYKEQMQEGVLVCNLFQKKISTYWVNPEAIGTQLARLTKIEDDCFTQDKVVGLIRFLQSMINCKVLIMDPNDKIPTVSLVLLKKQNQAISFISREELNKRVAEMKLPIGVASSLDAKLILHACPEFLKNPAGAK